MYTTKEPFHKNENPGLGEQTCPGGEGGIRNMWLTDAKYCSWNGFTMRSCCIALGKDLMFRYLHHNPTMGGKNMYTCMCNLVPMLYSRMDK